MKKTLYTILISGLILGASLSAAPKAFADCQQIYGGGQTCTSSYNFSIQKFVQKPGKAGGQYVNNLSINDPKFSPNQQVSFEIIVKNTGSNAIPTLTIKDTFPQFLNFVAGPGSFDSNSKILTLIVNNLGAGQSQTYLVTGKVADSSMLPSDQGTICLVNQATGTDNNGLSNTSSSQFCVEKTVVGTQPQVFATPKVVTTPATGPEMLPLLSLIPGGLAGFILRKKSVKTVFKGGEK